MAAEDAYQSRIVQREISRRYVDASVVDVRVIHGVAYMRGTLRHLRTHPEVDLEAEAEIIRKILRRHPNIRDVVWEVRYL